MVVNCAACYNRMKVANHEIATNQQVRPKVAEALEPGLRRLGQGPASPGSAPGRCRDLTAITEALKSSLDGLKVACYYGCLLVRPHEVTGFDDPENPTSLDRLVTAMGGESLDWPHKVECCGGGLSLSRTDVVVKLTDQHPRHGQGGGADCIAVSCPMCQINLDLRQQDIAKQTGKKLRHADHVYYPVAGAVPGHRGRRSSA